MPNPSFAENSEDAVRQAIIQESIASYPGNCPGPFNTTRTVAGVVSVALIIGREDLAPFVTSKILLTT